MRKAFLNWSGGKDSALALYHALRGSAWDVRRLFTTVTEGRRRISMHNVREELLQGQANSLGISLVKCWLPGEAPLETYEARMAKAVTQFKAKGIEDALFGDIFLEDLRAYREGKLAAVGIRAAFPLWKRDSAELVREFIDLGFKAVIVCVNERHLDKSFAGRLIDRDFIKDYPRAADVCGENGEYHSFVFDGPVFKRPVAFEVGETVYHGHPPPPRSGENEGGPSAAPPLWDTGFWYTDLRPVSGAEKQARVTRQG